jgi:glycosyltransferase involved in cell wall biosynthesis
VPSVCFVAPQAWPVLSRDPHIPVVGGAEVQQAILARLLAAQGRAVSMICLDYGQPDAAQVDGVTVRKIFRQQEGVPVLRFLHPRLTSMWRALKAVNADIYYFRSAAMWVGVLAEFCRAAGKRLVYAGASDKDFEPDQGGQIPYARDRWLYRRGLTHADAIVAQNEYQRTTCKAVYSRDAVVIPSVYELPTHRVNEDRNLILWVGTVHANKRPEIFFDLARRMPLRRFVMIGGPGADRGFYEAMKARASAIPNLEFKGFLPLAQVEPWFDRARVLVNTSTYEGMPNVFLQAWARGVPTVATVDVGVAEHRVAPTIDQLVSEVHSLFENPAAGQACKAYFQRTHSSSSVLARYNELFESLA